MISISISGLDLYIVGHLSKSLLKTLSAAFHTAEELISFRGTEAVIFHEGIDQNAWETLVQIQVPQTVKFSEAEVAKILYQGLKEHTIHIHVSFSYYAPDHRHSFVSKDYPRFITESNVVEAGASTHEPTEEIYTGDIFTGVQEQLDKGQTKSQEKKNPAAPNELKTINKKS